MGRGDEMTPVGTRDVQLVPVDERLLAQLLSLAVAQTKPEEVMPPCEAPPGWSESRRAAFCDFYRSHHAGLDGPTRTLMYAILLNGDVVGMIRMARRDEAETMETGIWLGNSVRGKGVGGAALRLILREAARVGARRVVADTTAANAPAIGVLRRCGANLCFEGSEVYAEILLGNGSSGPSIEKPGRTG
jgi:RimJ/RimL family protein N-acetyltransferase